MIVCVADVQGAARSDCDAIRVVDLRTRSGASITGIATLTRPATVLILVCAREGKRLQSEVLASRINRESCARPNSDTHVDGLSLQLFDGVSLLSEQFDDAFPADQMRSADDDESLVST